MKKIAVASAVALTTAGLVTGVLMAGGAAAAKPAAVEVKPVGAVAQTAPTDLAGEGLTYAKKGATVTVSKDGTVLATISLDSTEYTDSTGRVEFSVDARQPVVLDTAMFVLYDADGGENSADAATEVTLAAGQHSLVLTFSDTHGRPKAIGWAPSDGVAVWTRPAGNPAPAPTATATGQVG